jgi:drug/metabolite transporter (DMT)-like permease
VGGRRTASAARPRQDLRANASAALAAVLLGASVVAARVAVREVPPLSLAVVRFGQGFLLLAGAMLLLAPDRLRVARRRLPLLVLLGAVYFAAFPVTFNTGLRFTEASRGALMLASMQIWSALLGRVAGERLGGRQLAGIGLAFAEPGWRAGGGTALLGDGLLLLTGLLGAVYGLLAKRALARDGPVTVTAYAMLFGTLLVLPLALVEGLVPAVGRLQGRLLAAVVFLGVPGGAVAFLLWTWALSRLTPTRVAVYVNLNPLVAALLGVLLLAERRSGLFVLGFAAVVGGVLLVNWPARRARGAGGADPGRAGASPARGRPGLLPRPTGELPLDSPDPSTRRPEGTA